MVFMARSSMGQSKTRAWGRTIPACRDISAALQLDAGQLPLIG
jgi:hypothetical protein